MKHSGKARRAAFKMLLVTAILVALVPVAGLLATFIGGTMVALSIILFLMWFVFAMFTLFFFRDPTPRVPAAPNLVVSPAHARVDVIDTVAEPQFMGGECRRVSMFLSVLDVHVQNAPVGGKVVFLKHTEGQFLSAMKTESVTSNENVLIGFETAGPPKLKLGVRLVAGVLARRIVPWVAVGDEVARGDRISLIQFGSRAEVYLPVSARINVKVGDKMVGGETVLAVLE